MRGFDATFDDVSFDSDHEKSAGFARFAPGIVALGLAAGLGAWVIHALPAADPEMALIRAAANPPPPVVAAAPAASPYGVLAASPYGALAGRDVFSRAPPASLTAYFSLRANLDAVAPDQPTVAAAPLDLADAPLPPRRDDAVIVAGAPLPPARPAGLIAPVAPVAAPTPTTTPIPAPAPSVAAAPIAPAVPAPAPVVAAAPAQPAPAAPAQGRHGAQHNGRADRTVAAVDNRGFFERLLGLGQPGAGTVASTAPEGHPAGKQSFALAAPTTDRSSFWAPSGPPPGYDRWTAVYDISARTVIMPDGTRLEAHSGLGDRIDDPRYVSERDRGATPPHVYALEPREESFHGVQALRLLPVGEGSLFGRAGLLAHSYMLGPNGDSNGCVSFKDYDAFLRAYQAGQIKRLAVVARLN